MNTLYIQLQCEAALSEAIKAGVAFTVVGFEPDGELVACIETRSGKFWKTF